MQVNNIMAGLSDASSLAKGRTSAAATTAHQAAAAATPTVLAGNSPAVRAILAKYDVTDITPNEFTQMTQQLYAAGAISSQRPARPHCRADRSVGRRREPDDSINLVAFYQQKIQQAQSQTTAPNAAAQPQQIAPLVHRLDWVEKFKMMKDDPAATGVSALA